MAQEEINPPVNRTAMRTYLESISGGTIEQYGLEIPVEVVKAHQEEIIRKTLGMQARYVTGQESADMLRQYYEPDINAVLAADGAEELSVALADLAISLFWE